MRYFEHVTGLTTGAYNYPCFVKICLFMFAFPCTVCACIFILYYCNMVRWAWWDSELSRWLFTLTQCFDAADWVMLSEMIYALYVSQPSSSDSGSSGRSSSNFILKYGQCIADGQNLTKW